MKTAENLYKTDIKPLDLLSKTKVVQRTKICFLCKTLILKVRPQFYLAKPTFLKEKRCFIKQNTDFAGMGNLSFIKQNRSFSKNKDVLSSKPLILD